MGKNDKLKKFLANIKLKEINNIKTGAYIPEQVSLWWRNDLITFLNKEGNSKQKIDYIFGDIKRRMQCNVQLHKIKQIADSETAIKKIKHALDIGCSCLDGSCPGRGTLYEVASRVPELTPEAAVGTQNLLCVSPEFAEAAVLLLGLR